MWSKSHEKWIIIRDYIRFFFIQETSHEARTPHKNEMINEELFR